MLLVSVAMSVLAAFPAGRAPDPRRPNLAAGVGAVGPMAPAAPASAGRAARGSVAHPRIQARRAASRARIVGELEWSAAQVAVLMRAEVLRARGEHAAAQQLIVDECPLPSIQWSLVDYVMATSLDLHRWHLALYGTPWDGRGETMREARRFVGNRRRRRPQAVVAGGRGAGRASAGGAARSTYRTSNLLMDSFDNHENLQAVRDHTRFGGWAQRADVGHLEWDNPQGLACCFCGALLLPSEAQPVAGARTNVRGKHCCREGCAGLPLAHALAFADVLVADVVGGSYRVLAGRWTRRRCLRGRAGWLIFGRATSGANMATQG